MIIAHTEYAEQQIYIIVGQSSDDNVSGMTFERKELVELKNGICGGKVGVKTVYA